MSWLRGGIRGGLWNKHPVKLWNSLKKIELKFQTLIQGQ